MWRAMQTSWAGTASHLCAGETGAGSLRPYPTHSSSTSHAFLSLSSSCLVQPDASFSFSLPPTIRFTSLPPCGTWSLLSTDATALHPGVACLIAC